MNAQTLALVVSAALAVLGLLYAVLGWRRRRSPRALLHGIAVAVFFVGAWLTGVMELLANAAHGLVDWTRGQRLDAMMWAGIVCAGLGVVLYVIASFLSGVGRAEGRQRREAAMQKRLGVTGAPAASRRPDGAPTAGPDGAPAAEAADRAPDDFDEDEVTAILERRGIR